MGHDRHGSGTGSEYPLRPLYRFQLRTTAAGTGDARSSQRLAVVRALAFFVREVDQGATELHESASRDQAAGYESYRKILLAAHQQLQRDVLAQPVTSDGSDEGKRIEALLAQAKRLRGLATNAGDAFQIQVAADDAGDEPRHRIARGQLQESVLSSAEVVLQMHQDLAKLASDWAIEGEPGKDSPDALPAIGSVPKSTDTRAGGNAEKASPPTSRPDGDNPTSIAAADKTPSVNKAIDLLPAIDLQLDVKTGKWELGKEGLTCKNGGGKLRLPYSPGQEYDFHIEFTRLEGQGDVVQQLSQGEHRFEWLMGYWKNSAFGFGRIGGKSANQNATTVEANPALTNGQRYSCVVKVRQKSVTAWLDGKQIAHYETDYSDMSEQPAWVIDAPLGLGCNSSTIFHVVEVFSVTKDRKLTRTSVSQ